MLNRHMTKNEDTETQCRFCRQWVPITKGGKVARHYTPIGKQAGKTQAICDGSEKVAIK